MSDSRIPGADRQRGIGECLSIQAARAPRRPAISFMGQTVSREMLDRRANRMARALELRGIGQDDLVAIALPKGPDHHVASFAVWKLGATPLPLPQHLPTAELEAVVETASPTLIIGKPGSLAAGTPGLPPDFEPDADLSDAPLTPKAARHFKALCSGGSTGRPKVILDGMPALADPDAPLPMLLMQGEDVVLNPGPLYHTAAFSQTNWALCWGAHVIETEKFEPREWLRLVEAYRVTWTCLVPTMMSRIWSLPEAERRAFDLSSLRVVLHTGAPCPAWLKQNWIAWLGAERIWEVYSGTEGFGAAMIRGDEWLAHPGSVGRSFTEIRILRDDGQPAEPGEVGEIWFPPPGIAASRYIGADMPTREGWRTLGDMGWLDADGYLHIADRRTDMIVSGGVNIYPAEIEAALEAHPAIEASVVVGLAHADLGRAAHAVIQLRPGERLDMAALEMFLRGRLAPFKLPLTVEAVAQPLRDEAGKVRRAVWREACEAKYAAGAPLTSLRGHSSPV